MGSVQEYLRYPSDWEQIDKNLRKLVDLKSENVIIKPTPVIQNVNLSTIVELFEYFEQFNREANKTIIEIAPIVLNNPKHSDILYLPLEYKKKAWSRIKDWLQTATFQTDELHRIMTQVEEKCKIDIPFDDELENFRQQTELFDSHRNTNLKDVNPELYQIMYK